MSSPSGSPGSVPPYILPYSTRCSPSPTGPHEAERRSFPSLPPIHHHSLHAGPTTDSAIGHPLVQGLESTSPQSIHVPQPSPFMHTREQYSSARQSPDLDPTISHSVNLLPNSQPLHAVHQQHLQLPQARASTSHGPTYYGEGMFSGAHDFSVPNGTFIDISSDTFMKELLQHTIIGAEFDSSDRHPPPRCHPGTRLAIVERCKIFIGQSDSKEKIRWVVGPAGVGKSAIMQIVAEETLDDDVILGASVFFSVNGRQDGTKLFTTIAYQLAAKCEPYRQFIRNEIRRDPSLLRKSLPAQFRKFIIDPFVRRCLFGPTHRFLIIIDGLDECDGPMTQRELLGLISDLCIAYPASPVVWIIASRPEPHITSFFDGVRIAQAYTKEEIMINSDEACQDVQRYLRDELNEIKLGYPTLRHKREWPSELHFTKIAAAAGGLFAYASTVVRYINDPHYRDPATRLCHVLETIDAHPKGEVPGRDHPMAQLDALYQRILSNIPADIVPNTRKLLLVYSNYRSHDESFRSQCNILGLTEAAAYGAVCHLHAVAKVPMPDKADDEHLEYFHKSFKDFLFDPNRSCFSHNVREEADQLLVQCLCRIIAQVPDNFEGTTESESIPCHPFGYLKGAPDICDTISLSWPADECFQTTDDLLRLKLYSTSIRNICFELISSNEIYGNMTCFHALTTRFDTFGSKFPPYLLRDAMFDKFRPELAELGKLKQVPLRALDYAAICGRIDFRFMSPIGEDVKYSDPWNSSCEHEKVEVDDSLQRRRGWSTSFKRYLVRRGGNISCADIPRFNIRVGRDCHWDCVSVYGDYVCLYCLQRFGRYFINNPDQLVTVFVDSTGMCYVELSFVDREDGVSEWRYRFFHSGSPSCVI